LEKPNIPDLHGTVDALEHVIKGEGGDGDSGKCLHFHAGAGMNANLSLDPDPVAPGGKFDLHGIKR
jgi:hypothetical protein